MGLNEALLCLGINGRWAEAGLLVSAVLTSLATLARRLPWLNFAGWFITALVVLAVTTPWLISKKPAREKLDYRPLATWLLISLWLLSGNARHHLWLAAVAGLAGNGFAAVFAIRGARAS